MYVCFDIGGTFVKYGCLDERGTILLQGKFDTINHLENLLHKMKKITASYQKNFRIKGIGVSVPGVIKNNGFLITAGAISSLYNVNLKQKLEDILKLPVLIENDANSAALAEKWLGVAKEFENFVCLVLGTGIGGSIFINNHLYRGAHGVAGEFGWNVSSLTDTNNIELNSWNKKASIIDGLCNNYNNEVSLISSEFIPINDARMIFLKEKQGDVIAKKF